MKEIKNKTIYTSDNVKKFLEVYYFEKVKVPRLIINILRLYNIYLLPIWNHRIKYHNVTKIKLS